MILMPRQSEVDQKTRESQKRSLSPRQARLRITGNLRLRETLRDQSIRDPLTGLFNRALARIVGQGAAARKRKQRSLSSFSSISIISNDSMMFLTRCRDSVLQSMADIFRMPFPRRGHRLPLRGEGLLSFFESSIRMLSSVRRLALATKDLKLVTRSAPGL